MAIDPRTGKQLLPAYGPQQEPQGGAVDPTDALMEFFGGQSKQDPVTQLAGLRHDRQRTLEMGGNGEGNVPQQLATLNAQQHADPFTGDAETARVGQVQHALDVANTENLDPVKQQRQEDEQFTMDKLIKPIEAQGRTALAVEGQKAQAARDVADTRAGALTDTAGIKAAAGKPLSNDENNVMDKLRQTAIMGPQALQLMEQAHPGIGQDANKFKSWTDSLGAAAGGVIYRHGGPQTTSEAHINQVVGYLGEVIPRMVVNSVRSKQLLDDLKMHSPQVGFSDGENYERLKYVMDYILPATQRAIEEGHGQAASTPAAPAAYSANDPSTWQREQ